MTPAIEAFWRMWNERKDALERGISDGTLQEHVPAISEAVHAIDPNLQWEMGAGLEAEHYFCLAAPGNPELRVLAERWRAMAPPHDGVFEFHASRPGTGFSPSQELDFGVAKFAMADFRFATEWDDTRRRMHVKVHHPAFANAPEDLRGNATFIALDTSLGEDDVERWIGGVDLSVAPLADAVDLGALIEAIRERAKEPQRGDYTLLKGQLPDGSPILVTAQLALKSVDHLLLDHHFEVTIPLRAPDEHGLPRREEAERLDAAEDALIASLGHDAVHVGRETCQGQRVLHFHAAGNGPAPGRLDTWARALDGYQVQMTGRHDPGWDILRRW